MPADPAAARRPRPGPSGAAAPTAQASRRPMPQPHPKHAAVLPTGAAWSLLGRYPRLTRRGAAVAVAATIALVAVLSVVPFASADSPGPDGARRGSSAPAWVALPPATPVASSPAPVPSSSTPPRKLLQARPSHAGKPAPVDRSVISALAANGIPKVALNAYRVAATRLASAQPDCGIDWALIAGIGREESDHGQYGGAVLHADGLSTPRIIGPALDGVHWSYIPAPANGLALDGDAKYAHALGPMQFIPSTWALYGTDATGDGRADVFNINDAALSAARYLCAAGGNLRSHANQVRAVLAYNHSDQYVAQVLALADAYRRGIPITGIPVGITSGALPKVSHTGTLPPANPAAPPAADKSGKARAKTASKKPTQRSAPAARSSTRHQPTSATQPHSSTAAGPQPASSSRSTPPSAPSKSTSATRSSSPSPSKTCNLVQKLLGCKPS